MSDIIQIPIDFVCPISLQLMIEPVCDYNGHTFDRKFIEQWYQSSNFSPITNLVISNKDLRPNLIVKRQILEFSEKNREEISKIKDHNLKSRFKVDKLTYKPPNILINTLKTPEGVVVDIDTNRVEKTGAHRHFILLVDESGSMEKKVNVLGEKGEEVDFGLTLLDVVRHSVQTLINILINDTQHEYYLTIITFTVEAERECIFLKVDETNKDKFNRIIQGFSGKYTTNIWDAFRLAFQTIEEVKDSPIPLEHQIILFTDGVPNSHPFASQNDQYTPEQYFECIQRTITKKQIRCRINTMGFGRGNHLDSELLSGIANKFSGNFGFISDTSMLSTTWLYIIANLIHETDVSLPKILYTNDKGIQEMQINKLMNHQTRSLILKGEGIRNVRLQFLGSDDKSYEVNTSNVSTDEIEHHWLVEKSRYQLCNVIEQLLYYMTINQLEECTNILTTFSQEVAEKNIILKSPILTGYLEDIVSSGKAHDGGQISMATSRQDYYNAWGGHYLRALYNAHLNKCKSNFKDRGLNYDTIEIQESIKEMEGIFMDMPPPKASKQTYNTVHMQSSASLHNQGSGCFQASVLVTSANGNRYPVSKIKKGDLLKTPKGFTRVICVIEIMQSPNGCLMCDLGDNTLITPYHPIMYNGKWCFPLDHFPYRVCNIDKVYNFVLEKDHQIYINDILTPTFGHNLKGDVIEHPFFGSHRIIEDLEKLDGYHTGLVTISHRYFKRNTITNLVEKIEIYSDPRYSLNKPCSFKGKDSLKSLVLCN